MTSSGGTDRRPLLFLIAGVTALAAVAWTPLQELRGSLVATEFARAIAAGDSARLAQLSSAPGVRSALCAYRETDVRSWSWATGTAARRGRATTREVEYTVSVVSGRSLQVLVSPGWRPVPLGVRFARAGTADSSFARFDGCDGRSPAPSGAT